MEHKKPCDITECDQVKCRHLADDVVDVIIHVCLCVQRVTSQPVIFVSFQKQMSECHQVLLFKGDHHLVA